MFYVPAKDLFLIPTAEVPVTNLHSNEIIEPEDMPAVSYTHLLVSSPVQKAVIAASAADPTVVDDDDDEEAVSYTHLDVYKRQ